MLQKEKHNERKEERVLVMERVEDGGRDESLFCLSDTITVSSCRLKEEGRGDRD